MFAADVFVQELLRGPEPFMLVYDDRVGEHRGRRCSFFFLKLPEK